jgi:hypothetical protein
VFSREELEEIKDHSLASYAMHSKKSKDRAYLAEPLILPDHFQHWILERGLENTICDYIAG